MMRISFYQVSEALMSKAVCQLLEKCYDQNLKVVLIITQDENLKVMDQLLWTYSRRRFMPHATCFDAYPELQPIYITNKLENPNKADILMLLNPNKLELEKITIDFSRLIILYEDNKINKNEILKIQSILNEKHIKFEAYNQSTSGGWVQG